MKENFGEGFFQKKVPIDPSQSSMVEENIGLKRKRSLRDFLLKKQPRYIDQNKEEYFEITQYPELQKFASLLLKGTVNTSDILTKNGRYFSHIQKEKNVSNIEDAGLEFAVDHNLLRFLFEDGDHNTITVFPPVEDFKVVPMNGWQQHRNVQFGKNNDKVNFFDFGGVSNLEKFKESKYTFPVEALNPDHKQAEKEAFVSRMNGKIDQLLSTVFSEESGINIFKKILEKSGAKLGGHDSRSANRFFRYKFESETEEERTQELFNDLRSRLLYMKSKLDSSTKKQEDINQINSDLEDLYKPQ